MTGTEGPFLVKLVDLADCRIASIREARLPAGEAHDVALVGGKAASLGGLLRAGFPVPGGFVVTTAAYRHALGSGGREIPPDLADEIRRLYRDMGSPPVAVRSSATAEDTAEASMAGQYDTFLNITDERSLLNAIRDCWRGVDSRRTRAYLSEQGLDLSRVAMAVIVQRLVPADVAGVLFTADPRTGSREEMMIEASWGLGEAVVSGRVQPDVFRLESATGREIEARISEKRVWIPPDGRGERPVEEARRRERCLSPSDVAGLWELGRRASEHFGSPQDLEWAICEGQLFLLQSRAITTLGDAEAYARLAKMFDDCTDSTRKRLRKLLESGRGPWVRHNIGETLPHPRPLTWSVIRRFMSGSGGFGRMYADVGFEPSEKVSSEGFLELVAGRIYMDLSMAPEMFFEDYPFAYDLDRLRRDPDMMSTGESGPPRRASDAQSPPTVPKGSALARIAVGRRLARINARIHGLAADLDKRLNREIIPEFVAWCRQEKRRDLSGLRPAELLALWEERERRVLDEFAPQSLLPSLIGGTVLRELRAFLDENFWDEDPDDLTNLLASSGPPDKTMETSAGLYEVARGERSLDEWLGVHGHRGPEEFDLAAPRWRERPEELARMAAGLRDGADPSKMHRDHIEKAERRIAELRSLLPDKLKKELHRLVDLARRYLVFREDGKYYLMLGYDLLRDIALEAGRRLGIGEDVFMLTLGELREALSTGSAPSVLIKQRRAERRAEERLVLPYMIDAGAIDSLGEPPKVESRERYPAFPVSTGASSGPARIVHSPERSGELGSGYVLVCPSTDPAWTPLFVNAVGLVLERGGTLSHGAVVAREMGIPAVVLPEATRLFANGENILVDGREGCVARLAAGAEARMGTRCGIASPLGPDDERIPREMAPPVPGARERAAGRLRNAFLLLWGAYFAAAFALPESWLYRPSIGLCDLVLWPLVASLGKPATVALVALAFAALTMLGQRFLTDNSRLREAKRRAARLRRGAREVPRGSPRRAAMMAGAAPVQMRMLLAAFVPLAVILGPMITTFMWFPERVDPAAWGAPPGSAVTITAVVESDVREPVRLEVAAPLHLADCFEPSQTLPPIRETLEELRAEWSTGGMPGLPREVRGELLADLAEYLKEGVPDQRVAWRVSSEEVASGRFPVTVKVGGCSLTAAVLLGGEFPPGPDEVTAEAGSPLRSVKVTYPRPKERLVFWAPLSAFGLPDWDAGWLVTYLIVYAPVMFLLRWALKVA